MNKIVWLSSYPKSGNTWCRIFLENLQRRESTPANINELSIRPESRRSHIDDVIEMDSTELTIDEIDDLMPEVYQYWSNNAKELFFLKIHHAYTYLQNGQSFIPTKASYGAVYLVRNPLDVVVSLSHHNRENVSDSLKKLSDNQHCSGNLDDKFGYLTRQKLLSWSDHILSWLDNPDIRVLMIRYEDMKLNPIITFRKLAKFTDLYFSEAHLERAIRNSSFDQLRDQEQKRGFREKRPGSMSFFRKGEVGGWRDQLSPQQVNQIIEDHSDVMTRLGYLTPDRRLVY